MAERGRGKRVTYPNSGWHGRISRADTHSEIGIEDLTTVPSLGLIVQILQVCHRQVTGSRNDRATVVLFRRVNSAVAVGIGLGLQIRHPAVCAADWLAHDQSGAEI